MRAAMLAATRKMAGGGGEFDPEADISWHSLFWAEGASFITQGYSDTDPLGCIERCDRQDECKAGYECTQNGDCVVAS